MLIRYPDKFVFPVNQAAASLHLYKTHKQSIEDLRSFMRLIIQRNLENISNGMIV